MYSEVIYENTQRVLEKIAASEFIKEFYLAGGTALAIQLGHRESIDLDWFSAKEFSNNKIKDELARLGNFKVESEDEGTIHGILDEVKITFLHYDYPQLYPLIEFQEIKIADKRDIAAMKLDAVSARGSKKDFVDLYFLLEKYSLEQLLEFFEKKYQHLEYNKLHLLKSLCYFESANDDPMPIMLKYAEWKQVQEKIKSTVNDFLKK